MAGKVTPIVFVPRYTSLNGVQTFKTLPLNAVPYSGALITGWRSPFTGTSVSFGIRFFESTDRNTWTECAGDQGGDPGPGEEHQWSVDFSKRWFRVYLDLAGVSPGVSCWAQGLLVQRHA